ncbi:hypothetical protein BC827DRAFT_1212856 [Russula dissimulans]|nr:hypothetical protein BC827DRAFT_1212856 [Russula dissimulans]
MVRGLRTDASVVASLLTALILDASLPHREAVSLGAWEGHDLRDGDDGNNLDEVNPGRRLCLGRSITQLVMLRLVVYCLVRLHLLRAMVND